MGIIPIILPRSVSRPRLARFPDRHAFSDRMVSMGVVDFANYLLAAVCSLWFGQRHRLTGNPMVDGTLSVVLGLFICSPPPETRDSGDNPDSAG
jgi:hypothetical protein